MINLTRAALAKAEPVPAGIYDIRITSAEATTSGSGHTSLMLTGEVADGSRQGRKLTDSLMLTSVDEQRLAGLIRRGLQMTAQLLDAVAATDTEREAAGADLMQLGRLFTGRTVRVTTGVTVDQRDGTRREIIVKVQPSPLDQVEQVIG
jgi:Protein of unknown function (DUF669)